MAPSKTNERKKNTSAVQLEIMITFMEKNIDFARGKLKKEENERFWETLVKKLNACPDGPVKDTSKWKQCWYHRKRCVKKDVKRLCEEQKLSARDALEVSGLKDMQYRVLKIMGDNIFDEEEKSYASASDDQEETDEETTWNVTPLRTRSSLKPTGAANSPSPNNNVTEEDKGSQHFAVYIADRLAKIKSEKKRKNLEDEIIDLVRKCTLND